MTQIRTNEETEAMIEQIIDHYEKVIGFRFTRIQVLTRVLQTEIDQWGE